VALATLILKCDGAKLTCVLQSSLRNEKHKCALPGIAKMPVAGKKSGGNCMIFTCFGLVSACVASEYDTISDSQTAPSRRKRCVGKKKQKIFLGLVCESARSRDVKLNMPFAFVKRYVFCPPSRWAHYL